MKHVAILRANLRWGSREIERRDIDGDWPDEIERAGLRFRPSLNDTIAPWLTERTYYEVREDDDC